ncbi:MAG: MerR family DNA-binding protein [Xanthomonadales bacterium]|nr:MerR family DNA-binding protein [Xanthomonadales bacterium]
MISSNKQGATLTVRRLAQQAGVTVHVVRNCLRRGLLRASARSPSGYQLFSAAELQRLQFIRTAQRLGFTLAEIEEIIRRSRQRKSPCPMVRDLLGQRLEQTRTQLEELLALQRRMTEAIDHWADLPDATPSGNDVCALIESLMPMAPPPASTPGVRPPFWQRPAPGRDP